MNTIHYHIKTLLSTYDCVIIPDFGAFIADYCPPVVSDEQSTIPGKDILFNRSLTRNDGLLINALIEEKGIEYAEAKLEIERYVKEINRRLNGGETICIDGIGELSLDEAGFVQFVANENNTCLLSSYGLKPITLKKIFGRNVERKQALPAEETISHTQRVIMRIASVAAIVALLLVFSPPLMDKSTADFAALGFDCPVPDVEKTVQQVVDSSLNKVDSVVRQDSVKNTDIAEESIIQKKYFHIIVASLPTEALADQYVHTFKYKDDFDTLNVIKSAGRCRVSVAHFEDKAEAVSFVRSLRLNNPKFSDAWVLSQAF